MEKRLHPAFQDDSAKPTITYNPLMDEFITAEAYGFDAYFGASHEYRSLMLNAKRIRDAISAMTTHDTREAARRDAQSKK